jgi:hypothetical protein
MASESFLTWLRVAGSAPARAEGAKRRVPSYHPAVMAGAPHLTGDELHARRRPRGAAPPLDLRPPARGESAARGRVSNAHWRRCLFAGRARARLLRGRGPHNLSDPRIRAGGKARRHGAGRRGPHQSYSRDPEKKRLLTVARQPARPDAMSRAWPDVHLVQASGSVRVSVTASATAGAQARHAVVVGVSSP